MTDEAARPRQQATPTHPISDTEAMDRIQAILSGEEWGPDTTHWIAEVVRLTWRVIEEPQSDDEEAEK